MIPTPLGFRCLGGKHAPRVLTDRDKAEAAYAAAAPGLPLEAETYLSAFAFPADLAAHMKTNEEKYGKVGSTAGYHGPTGVPRLLFDIDREALADALEDGRTLAGRLAARYAPGSLYVAFSGSKGFHLAVNTGGAVAPSPEAHAVARRLAETIAGEAGITIDTTIYDRVRLFRAANSRHPATGRHKVPIPLEDLAAGIDVVEVKRRAARPIPHELPTAGPGPRFLADWSRAEAEHRAALAAVAARPVAPNEAEARINPTTWGLILDPVSIPMGDRHRTIFSSAADLAERYDDVDDLIAALLTPRALLTGLPPSEVARQIATGIRHGRGA